MKVANSQAKSEAQLLAAARGGDGQAFDELVSRHADRVYGLLLRHTASPEEAEDLAQECFLRAFKGLDSFRGGASFFTWVYRIAVNLSHSNRRSMGRRRKMEVQMSSAGSGQDDDEREMQFAAEESPPDQPLHQQETINLVQEALATLKDDYRQIVILRDVQGMDYEGIAALAGITRQAVKSRLHRARGELALVLQRMGYVSM